MAVGGATGASGGLGASSPLPSWPRCAAPLRVVVSPGAHGGEDLRLRGYLREVFDRILADGYLRVVSAASCVGASSLPLPPPPRAAPLPRPLSLRLMAAEAETSETSSARCLSCWLPTDTWSSLRARLRVRLAAPHPRLRSLLPVGTEAETSDRYTSGLSPTDTWTWRRRRPASARGRQHLRLDTTRPRLRSLRRMAAAAETSETPSTSCSNGSSPTATCTWRRQHPAPLFASARSTSSFVRGEAALTSCLPSGPGRKFIGDLLITTDLLNPNAQNSKATLLITQKDRSEAYYTQGRSLFPHDYPRIQELNADGTNFNAHEEPDDLSDAPAPFITNPQLFAQLSSDTGLKSRKALVYTTTNFNSAIRVFDHATNAQLIGSCTSVPHFCLNTDYTPRRSQFYSLHHEHATRTDTRMTHEVLTCCQCETSASTIQCLLRLNSIIEQKLEELSENNIEAVQNTKITGDDTRPLEPKFQLTGFRIRAPQFCLTTDNMPGLHPEHEVRPPKPESDHLAEDSVRNLKGAIKAGERCDKQTSEDSAPEPNSPPNPPDTEYVGNFQGEKLMEKFNKLLVDCVFFALPQVLIFFPRYQASEEKPNPEQRLSLLAIIQQTDNQSNEKVTVIFFFVMFVSAWLLGLVLSLFGRGKGCTFAVSLLTLWTVGSTAGFVDYMLCKCLPEAGLFTWLFRGHFVAMAAVIVYIWFTYVGVPKFPSLPSCQGVFHRWRGRHQNPVSAVDDAEEKDQLKKRLLPV
ncbi:unnamed protein product [Alopecurus aequalis]